MIIVANDVDGLRVAAMELFASAADDKDISRALASIDPDDTAQLAKLIPQSSVSPGYLDRVTYLLWLEDKMRAGIAFAEISADEAEGIAAIQRARYEFERDNPMCPDCGVRNRMGSRHVCPERQRRNASANRRR